MSNHAKDGMYFLQFSVSDLSHGQSNIQANVTVEVSSLKPEVIAQAVPILIINHTPRDLLSQTQGSADTPLEKLMASVSAMVGGSVSVLSLEDRQVELTSTQHRSNIKQPCMTRLWLKAGHPTHALDQLLLLHRTLISQESRVQIYNVGVGGCVTLESSWSWLVDANITSLVTPRLVGQSQGCHCHPRVSTQPATCDTNPCLNGGRCVLQARGPICMCPEGTSGPLCKQLSRHFPGGGWAWVAPIPSCSSAHITMEIKTQQNDAQLLYSGPWTNPLKNEDYHQEDVLSLDLVGGRLRLLLSVGGRPVLLTSSPAHPILADGYWHRIDIIWNNKNVEVVVDMCESGESCRLEAPLPPGSQPSAAPAPLQLGGLAHPAHIHYYQAWPKIVTQPTFKG
ncbi:unnamed protein product, partial [Meganyctiphanes norvegica]